MVRYPRLAATDDSVSVQWSKRTLTALYNERPSWLTLAHRALDEAVFAAYAWESELTSDEIICRLLELNQERGAGRPTPETRELLV